MSLKKMFTVTVIFCATIFIFGAKSFAAELEMVSYSAQVRLQWLANVGHPEAQKISKALGKIDIFGKQNLKDYDRIEKVNGIYQEINTAGLIDFVRKNDYRNIMDIGCGYSPRGVILARDGRKYIGAELNAIAISAMQIMPGIVGKEFAKNISYEDVPVEDREAMLGTAHQFDGEICIVEHGLIQYLTMEKTDTMFTLVKEILKKHGGCYITLDFAKGNYFKEIAGAIYGYDQAQLIYEETGELYEELFGDAFYNSKFPSQADAVTFLNNHGLKVEMVPILTDFSQLYCTKNLNAAQIEKLKDIAAKKYLWVITSAD